MKCIGYVICDGDEFIGIEGINNYIDAGNPTISGEYTTGYTYPHTNKLSKACILDTKKEAEDMFIKMSHYHYNKQLTIKEIYI